MLYNLLPITHLLSGRGRFAYVSQSVPVPGSYLILLVLVYRPDPRIFRSRIGLFNSLNGDSPFLSTPETTNGPTILAERSWLVHQL